MEKISFRMQLNPGNLEAYKKHHDHIWPELVDLLKDAGIRDYSIHHDPETNALFATLWRTTNHKMDGLSSNEIMRRWWEFMAPLMRTNPDGSPYSTPLETVFYMP